MKHVGSGGQLLFHEQQQRSDALVDAAAGVTDGAGIAAVEALFLGDAQLQAGDEAKALASYQRFVALRPQHARSAALQAWIADPKDRARRPVFPAAS